MIPYARCPECAYSIEVVPSRNGDVLAWHEGCPASGWIVEDEDRIAPVPQAAPRGRFPISTADEIAEGVLRLVRHLSTVRYEPTP